MTTLGVPWVVINLDGPGSHERKAAYRRGSGSDTLVFAYTVPAIDLDRTGVALPAGESEGFTGNVRVYQAGTENPVNGYIPGFDDAPDHLVAGKVHVRSIQVGSEPGDDGVYEMGDTIELLVTFVDRVTVTGTPQLRLDLDVATRMAAFKAARSATGSVGAVKAGEVLVFAYTVRAADEAVNGIAIEQNAIELNGGAIVGLSGDEPSLSNQRVTFADHPVIEVAPALVSARTSHDGSQVIITFSEYVRVDPAQHTLSAFAGIDAGMYLGALIDV